MNSEIIRLNPLKQPIQADPGFLKKELATHHLDLLGLCQFKCRYCSSPHGQYVMWRREEFISEAELQLGRRLEEGEWARHTYRYVGIIERLERQLEGKKSTLGEGKTLVFSMRTDGFSPSLVLGGTTRQALELMLEHTSFRIRVLTKNSVVGSNSWIDFFKAHKDRFVVGLSIGTGDDAWARRIECGVPPPSRRLDALQRLQDAGIPTFGMLCPVFPGVLEGDRLERLLDSHRPDRLETLWCEPYNDRKNWKLLRDAVPVTERKWFEVAFGDTQSGLWSLYATELYDRVIGKASADGWGDKVRYLLYEGDITDVDAQAFAGLHGVLLQSKSEDGHSRHPVFAELQAAGMD